MYMYEESTFSHIVNWHTDLGLKGAGVSENSMEMKHFFIKKVFYSANLKACACLSLSCLPPPS